jgi:hypothetical protein
MTTASYTTSVDVTRRLIVPSGIDTEALSRILAAVDGP